MSCNEIRERLSAFQDRELSADERARVERHLASCAACGRELAALGTLERDLTQALVPGPPSHEELAERVIESLRAGGAGGVRRRPRPPLWLAVSLAAAAGFLLAFWIFGRGAAAPRRGTDSRTALARLTVATGAVEVREPGEASWRPLATGGGVERGSTLRTPPAVKCAFSLQDGTELRVNGGTEIELAEPRRLALRGGQIFTRVTPAPIHFVVATDQGLVEALGTTLDITHRPSGDAEFSKEGPPPARTTVLVLDGEARLAGTAVPSGYFCEVVGGAVQEPKPARDLAMMTSWVNEILALGGSGRAELEQRIDGMLAMIGRTKMEFLYESEIRALGDHCSLPLARYLAGTQPSDDRDRRENAARILADVAGAARVGDLIGLLQDGDPAIRVFIARGLQRLTGQTLGYEEDYWRGGDLTAGTAAWREFIARPDSPWNQPNPVNVR